MDYEIRGLSIDFAYLFKREVIAGIAGPTEDPSGSSFMLYAGVENAVVYYPLSDIGVVGKSSRAS